VAGNLSGGRGRRWEGTTVEERRENTRAATRAAQAKARHDRIDRAIAQIAADAPPLTEDQKSRLRSLLGGA
jgi:hypothetical protein